MTGRSGSAMLLVFAAVASAGYQRPHRAAAKFQTIVFVCQYGRAKSVVAARFFNRMAAEQRLAYRGVARGIQPEVTIPPYVREPVRADGFEIGADENPVRIDVEEIRAASAVVCIMCRLPKAYAVVARQTIEWTDVPDVDAGYDAARDKIVAHLNEFVTHLAQRSTSPRS
jgi:arsenate reductase